MSGVLSLIAAGNAPSFTPGSVLRTTSGTFSVPTGTTTLVIEIWGGGGGGGTGYSGTGGSGQISGTAGTQTSLVSPFMIAKGGGRGGDGNWDLPCFCCGGFSPAGGGSAGTLTNGSTGPTGSVIAINVQVQGSAGGNSITAGGDAHGGAGHNGFLGNGGVAGTGGTQVALTVPGINATNYAASGSGSGGSATGGPNGTGGSGGGGGCAGGYVKYTMTSSIPASITFTVGAKGVGTKLQGTFPPAGDGSDGVVRFTYS